VVLGRAAALCQLKSGSLQPAVGSARGDIIIEKASTEDRRGHSPQTPRGETPQGGKQHTGEPHPPTKEEKCRSVSVMVVSRCLGIGPPSGIPPLGRCFCWPPIFVASQQTQPSARSIYRHLGNTPPSLYCRICHFSSKRSQDNCLSGLLCLTKQRLSGFDARLPQVVVVFCPIWIKLGWTRIVHSLCIYVYVCMHSLVHGIVITTIVWCMRICMHA